MSNEGASRLADLMITMNGMQSQNHAAMQDVLRKTLETLLDMAHKVAELERRCAALEARNSERG